MKKLYFVICGKYRKLEKPKASYLLEKTLDLSIICSKCKNEDENLFKEEESIDIILVYWKHIITENVSQQFRSKNMNETRNYSFKWIQQNEFVGICTIMTYIEYFNCIFYVFQLLVLFLWLVFL